MTPLTIADRITNHRKMMGSALTIMAHHYQTEDVIRHADITGDSLELAKKVSQIESKHIMFCGVYFMAESAALLSRPGQFVHLPEPSAECSMALMSPADRLDKVMCALTASGRKVVPLAYVNSTLAVKAVVGLHGGAVCTSANALKMLQWAVNSGDAVLFLPDKNLGANIADTVGIPQEERHIIDIRSGGTRLDMEAANKASLLLWPGFCAIHARFNLRQIERIRTEHPGAKVIVHPECTPEVVAASDFAGSTSSIINYVKDQPAGATVVIGTEINLVERLASKYSGKLSIMPLVESACTHMAQTTETTLIDALDALAESEKTKKISKYQVSVADHLKADAKRSLDTMLRVVE